LGHHANAIALPQTAEEVLLGPSVVEAGLLGLQDFRHIPSNHPPYVDANLFFVDPSRAHAHERTPPLATSARSPLRGCATLLLPHRFRSQPAAVDWTGRMVSEWGLRLLPLPTSPPDLNNAPFLAQGHSTGHGGSSAWTGATNRGIHSPSDSLRG